MDYTNEAVGTLRDFVNRVDNRTLRTSNNSTGDKKLVVGMMGDILVKTSNWQTGKDEFDSIPYKTALRFMREGCVVNADGVVMGKKLKDVESSMMTLSDDQITLIAGGKCSIVKHTACARTIISYPPTEGIQILSINTVDEFQGNHGQSVNIEPVIRLASLHKMIDDCFGVNNIVGYSNVNVMNDGVHQYLTKTRKKMKRAKRLDYSNYGIDKIDRIKDSSIEGTIERWNDFLRKGMYIVCSDESTEFIARVNPSDITEIAQQKMYLAMNRDVC